MSSQIIRACCISVLFTFATCESIAQGAPASAAAARPAQTPAPPPATQEAFIEQLKKTVVFITGRYNRMTTVRQKDAPDVRENMQQEIRGTGYLVSVSDTVAGTGIQTTYVVTNRHMIREPGPDGTLGKGPYLDSIEVRVNLKAPDATGSQFATERIPVVNQAGQMYCYVDTADPDADLALCPIPLDLDRWDVKLIGPDSFLNAEKIKSSQINETNEIFFAGLFAPFIGVKRNYPVVRHGKIAMLAGERMPVLDPTRTAEVYLGDVMSFGGNSGSPVMVRYGGMNDSGFGPSGYYLLGTMQGYFNVNAPVTVQTATAQGIASENTGVAVIVPALKIAEILALPDTTYCRRAGQAQYLDNSGKAGDALSLWLSLDKSPPPSRHQLWCEYMSHLGAVRNAAKLKTDTKAIPAKQLPDSLPNLAWRQAAKAAVRVEFSQPTPPFDLVADVFVVSETADSLTLLPSDYLNAEPEPVVIKKSQLKSLTLLQ